MKNIQKKLISRRVSKRTMENESEENVLENRSGESEKSWSDISTFPLFNFTHSYIKIQRVVALMNNSSTFLG